MKATQLESLVKQTPDGDVGVALNLLREALGEEEKRIRGEGSQAMAKGEKSKHIRWRNTAQWARNTMVNDDGRMKKGSRQGYWEISDKGRAWLKKSI